MFLAVNFFQGNTSIGQVAGNGEFNKSQLNTLQFIRQHEGCQAQEISELMDVPFSTIDKHIRVLFERGYIERRGGKKTGGYYVIEK